MHGPFSKILGPPRIDAPVRHWIRCKNNLKVVGYNVVDKLDKLYTDHQCDLHCT